MTRAARRDREPQLDLRGEAGYAGFAQDSGASPLVTALGRTKEAVAGFSAAKK